MSHAACHKTLLILFIKWIVLNSQHIFKTILEAWCSLIVGNNLKSFKFVKWNFILMTDKKSMFRGNNAEPYFTITSVFLNVINTHGLISGSAGRLNVTLHILNTYSEHENFHKLILTAVSFRVAASCCYTCGRFDSDAAFLYVFQVM